MGVAICRSELTDSLPAEMPAAAAAIARDTLGGAVAVAGELPDRLGAAVLQTAREAFVQGMHLTSAIAALVAVGLALPCARRPRSGRWSSRPRLCDAWQSSCSACSAMLAAGEAPEPCPRRPCVARQRSAGASLPVIRTLRALVSPACAKVS